MRNAVPGHCVRTPVIFPAGFPAELLFPLLAGESLQVGDGILLVHDLLAEQRLDDVLHRDDALETAVLVPHLGDMLLVLDHLLPDGCHGLLARKREDRAPDVGQAVVETVFGQLLQDGLFQHVAGDVVGAVAVDRDAREDAEEVVGVEFAERGALGGRGGHGPRGHDLAHGDVVQPEEVLDHLVLAGLEDALLPADAHHGGDLLAADREGLFLRRDEFGDQLREEHERVADDDHRADDRGRRHGQLPPVAGADGLGDDLREDEDQDGQHGRDDAEVGFAEDLDGLGADACGTDRVGDGVERKYGRDRLVDVLLLPHEQRGVLGALLLLHGDEGHRRGEQDGFEDRTEERDGESRRQIKYDEFHEWCLCGCGAVWMRTANAFRVNGSGRAEACAASAG